MGLLKTLIDATYPFRMKFSEITGVGISVIENEGKVAAPIDFYTLSMILNTGHEISFERYRGKKLLLVNVAGKCGFTPQYTALEKLYQNESELEILGFPSNDFGNQEPGTDKDIARFCELNYGVSFPLFSKSNVKGPGKNAVFNWLTDKTQNGWNEQEPKWNFYKYLIDERGNLEKWASSSVEPEELLR